MGLLDRFDFTHGQLPPWLAPLVSLTRPMATTLTAMIIPIGAFVCGAVAAADKETAMAMAEASGKFLHGIPEPLYWMVGGIFGAYSFSKSAEVIKGPVPPGTPAPEQAAIDSTRRSAAPVPAGIDPENLPPR